MLMVEKPTLDSVIGYLIWVQKGKIYGKMVIIFFIHMFLTCVLGAQKKSLEA